MASYFMKWVAEVEIKKEGAFYSVSETELEAVPKMTTGVYIFARRYDSTYTPIYVGMSKRLRARIGEHLDHVPFVKGLAKLPNGNVVVLVATVATRPGQKAGNVAGAVESLLIRSFHADGHQLLNEQGTKRAARSVIWRGTNDYLDLVPREMLIQKG